MDGCETLNPKSAEWLRNIQTLKGVGECETLNPKRTSYPKRSGCVRNPKP